MAKLLRKVFILILLSLIVVSVYLIKNESARTDVFARLGLASSRNFQIPDNIKVGLDDIHMEKTSIGEEEEPVFAEISESLEKAGGAGSTSIEARDEKPENVIIASHKVTLEEVEEQIAQISQEVEKLQEQVKILIAMNEIKQEINDLAKEAEGMNIECSECNILTSV